MLSPYLTIFEDAAIPQQALFLAFLTVTLLGAAIAVFSRFKGLDRLSPLLKTSSFLCPCLGGLCAALNGFHMMQTTLRLPIEPTLKMWAPGLEEISALVAAGAVAGLASALAYGLLRARELTGVKA